MTWDLGAPANSVDSGKGWLPPSNSAFLKKKNLFLPVFCNFHSLQEMAPFNYFEKNCRAGLGGGRGERVFFGNFALLGFQAFNEYFWERGSSGKYPTHFKKITSYAFLLVSKILQSM